MKRTHFPMSAAIASLLLPLSGIAEPTVTPPANTTLTHGQTLTITGAGFGTKTSPSPKVWDDFSAGNNGDLLSLHGWKIDSDNPVTDRPQLSTEKLRHSGAKFSAKFHFPRATTPLQDLGYKENLPVSGKKRFVDYWIWYQMPEQPAGATQHQLKLFKLQSAPGPETALGAGPGNDGWPALNTYAWRYNSGSRATYCLISTNDTHSSSNYTDNHFTNGAWNHVKMLIDAGTEGSSNGILQVWVNGSSAINKSGLMFIDSGYGAVNWFNNLQIGKYLGNTDYYPSSETTIYYGEVYYDDSWSRVEIGDNAIYSLSQHTEIQPTTAWANGSITMNINQGSFAAGSSAYLYVIDENGSASPGTKITFGNGSASPKPEAPKNLIAR